MREGRLWSHGTPSNRRASSALWSVLTVADCSEVEVLNGSSLPLQGRYDSRPPSPVL